MLCNIAIPTVIDCHNYVNCLHFAANPGYNIERVGREISQASGEFEVAGFLLHGGPRVGKTCSKRLILNQKPQKQNSTALLEDPVKAVRSSCTSKMISADGMELEEIDENKMIQMIQHQVLEAASQKEVSDGRKHSLATTEDSSLDPEIIDPSRLSSDKNPRSPPDTKAAQSKHLDSRSVVLQRIAAGINSIGSGLPAFFKCRHINLVDSGGQPQFSNLLPLVLRSQRHNHLVVTRLDEKLSDRSTNCFEINGVRYVLPENLQLTHYQLIERVCQLASGSKSHVIIIGTHLDEESKAEPLAKKNELLAQLMKKYEKNLVLFNGEPIFAVNAMAPEGEERTKYAKALQEALLNAPLLAGTDGDAVGMGIIIALRWMVLELELSSRSKGVDVLQLSEIKDIAEDLQIDNLPRALEFFNELGVLYHYPEALPNVIFTSITPISKQLSAIVEASFPHCIVNPSDSDHNQIANNRCVNHEFTQKVASQVASR